jgi:HSP20 family protein
VSRTSKKRDFEEGESSVLVATRGRMTILDLAGESGFRPPADIHETEDRITIRLELPGIAPESIGVYVQGTTVEVIGEKFRDDCGTHSSFLCLERTFGRFYRAFDITGCLNMAALSASLKEGILSLYVPKCEERRGRRRRVPVAEES